MSWFSMMVQVKFPSERDRMAMESFQLKMPKHHASFGRRKRTYMLNFDAVSATFRSKERSGR